MSNKNDTHNLNTDYPVVQLFIVRWRAGRQHQNQQRSPVQTCHNRGYDQLIPSQKKIANADMVTVHCNCAIRWNAAMDQLERTSSTCLQIF